MLHSGNTVYHAGMCADGRTDMSTADLLYL